MARRTCNEPGKRPTAPVRLPRDLVEMALVLAAKRRGRVADVLDEILRGPLQQQYDRLGREIAAAGRGRKKAA